MHITTHLLSTFGLAAFAAAAAFTAPHPCKAFPAKVSKLETCATASSFCSSYLGGTASFTRTSTTTTTVALAPVTTTVTESTTTTTTSTVDTTTITATDTATTFTTISPTTTITIYSSVCDNPGKLKLRTVSANIAAAAATTACGIAASARPVQVSDACNCILASSTTVTSTTTSGVATVQTVTETDTVTEMTSVTATSTTTPTTTATTGGVETACVTSFYIMLENARLHTLGGGSSSSSSTSDNDGKFATVGSGSGGSISFPNSDMASSSLFQINSEGYLEYAGKELQVFEEQGSSAPIASVSSALIKGPDAFIANLGLSCQVTNNLQLICSVDRPDGQRQTAYWSCGDSDLGIERQYEDCPVIDLFIVPSDGVSN